MGQALVTAITGDQGPGAARSPAEQAPPSTIYVISAPSSEGRAGAGADSTNPPPKGQLALLRCWRHGGVLCA
jgi:hypothetical protein